MATYEALGRAVPQARVESGAGWCICSSALGFSFGNFAVVADGLGSTDELWSVTQRALDLTSNRPPFRLFGVRTRPIDLALPPRVRVQQRMAMMICERVGVGEPLPMVPAVENPERDRVARFIVEQFFGQHDRGIRQAVGDATARSPHALLAWPDARSPSAAVMVSRSRRALGVYNLCVEAGARGHGLGSRIVASCADMALLDRSLATLQCDPGLEPWYQSMGFHSVGTVEVFARSRSSSVDVI